VQLLLFIELLYEITDHNHNPIPNPNPKSNPNPTFCEITNYTNLL